MANVSQTTEQEVATTNTVKVVKFSSKALAQLGNIALVNKPLAAGTHRLLGKVDESGEFMPEFKTYKNGAGKTIKHGVIKTEQGTQYNIFTRSLASLMEAGEIKSDGTFSGSFTESGDYEPAFAEADVL